MSARPSPDLARLAWRLLAATALCASASGCVVASVAGTVVSTTVSVAGTAISTTADVVGAGVGAVVGDDDEED